MGRLVTVTSTNPCLRLSYVLPLDLTEVPLITKLYYHGNWIFRYCRCRSMAAYNPLIADFSAAGFLNRFSE